MFPNHGKVGNRRRSGLRFRGLQVVGAFKSL